MIDGLPEGTKLKKIEHGGRTILRIELPPGSPDLTRKQKQHIKALVRKQVKLEKTKAKKALIHESADTNSH